jgi:GWxTD domain-containing protein
MRALLLFACCSALSLASAAQSTRRQEEKLRKELQSGYSTWIREDVAYIITDEERQAFSRLQTDDEREQFVEQFWLRRDPTPDTLENEFKEEHYRRIAYANQHFASGIAGWRTDRGRLYITFGPPDEIESHPAGGPYDLPIEEGGGRMVTCPFEKWRFRHIEGIGTDIVIEFVDPSLTGEYRMALDPSEKDAMRHVPNANQTATSQVRPPDSRQFDRLFQYAALHRPQPVRFKDLEALVTTNIQYNVLPMWVRADYLRVTDSTVLTPVTIQFENRDLQFKEQDGLARATVNLYLRITSVTRRVVSVQEDVVTVESQAGMLQETSKRSSVYQRAFFLAPGWYRLNVVARDVNGGNTNNVELALHVPQFEPGKLAASNIILADLIEKVPSRTVGSGQFVLGALKVRPRVSRSFQRGERMGIYFQVYEMAGGRPNGTLEYQVIRNGSSLPILDFTEEISSLPDASAQQVTVEKMLPLARLELGEYTLKIVITDRNRNRALTPTATFSVR